MTTMFKIAHEKFCFVTTDVQVATERVAQGFYVAIVDFITQPIEQGKRVVNFIDYGNGLILPKC